MGERRTTDLVIAALVMALGRRQRGRDLVHHGSQYTSLEFTNRLHDWGLVCSYASVGDCFDSSAMEGYWATMKTEIRRIWGPPRMHQIRDAHHHLRLDRDLLQPHPPPSQPQPPHPIRGLRHRRGRLSTKTPCPARSGQLQLAVDFVKLCIGVALSGDPLAQNERAHESPQWPSVAVLMTRAAVEVDTLGADVTSTDDAVEVTSSPEPGQSAGLRDHP